MWLPSGMECPGARAFGNYLRALLCTSLLVALVCQHRGVHGCSPTVGDEPTLVETVHQSKAIWHGKILRRFPDRSFVDGAMAYTAEMSIHCIIKGPNTRRISNITGAGSVPGMCHTTNLEIGKDYIVLLYPSSGKFHISGAEIQPTEENLNKVYSACGLEPKYPEGSNENTADTKCKAPITPCVKSVHDVTPNVTVPPGLEPIPTKPDGHHNGDDHDHLERYPDDGHNHTSAATPPPHHEGDGHDHSKDGGHTKDHDHHEGDGHDHDAHHDGDHDHYDGDDHDHSKHHHDGDGHDHDNVIKDVKPVSGESKDGKNAATVCMCSPSLSIAITTAVLLKYLASSS